MCAVLKLIVFTLSIIVVYSSNCPNDPKKWCSTVETAKACEVFEQCAKNVWKPGNPYLNLKPLTDDNAVNLTLYYETLCPDSKAFINGQLWDAYQNISTIMNLTLVPYGNARETWRNETKLWQFTCQHGADECLGNLIQTCLINYRPKTDDHFPFIHCMESNNQDDVTTAATKCGVQLNITLDDVFKCANSRLGNNLEHTMAVKTDSLQPKHTYVPWITLNGVHTEEMQQQALSDLIELICSTYMGSKIPPACNH